jgi:hypothetical protein
MHTLTLDQVTEKLLPAIAQDRLFAAIFLGFGTGLRRGEVLGLRWKDVDVKTGTLQVRQTLVRVTNHHVPKGEGRTRLIAEPGKLKAYPLCSAKKPMTVETCVRCHQKPPRRQVMRPLKSHLRHDALLT